MDKNQLTQTARALVTRGKGILAADESLGTITKRLEAVGATSTEETRRGYRELLFTAPGLGEYISGVILFDETIRQKASDGRALVEVLRAQGIIPGIKVDKGTKPLAHFPGEKTTEGLDGLRERLQEYVQLGAQFTKWREVISIGPNTPHPVSLEAHAFGLARFAALSQEAGLVPIVEPEVLMDGDHPMERHFEVTDAILQLVFDRLHDHRVQLEGMLLKPNMILPGKSFQGKASVSQVAAETLRCLRRTVPAAVPGIAFLSGGQSDRLATEHLNAMNQLGHAPWELSFSFGRALQAPALKAWSGNPQNTAKAQETLLHRARCNAAARLGHYSAELESK